VPTPVVFLHGFAGTPRHWDRVLASLAPGRFEPIALDVTQADPLTPDGVAALVAASTPERLGVVGYSMGGRLALHTALAFPDRVARLVLVSASAGIDDPAARAARRAADDALAESIEHGSIEQFIERWSTVPLFAADPGWVKEEVALEERRCAPSALARCLRTLGPGAMEPMWGRLGELSMPAAILAGARDSAYVAAGRRLAAAIGDAKLTVVAGSGHRLALEAPVAIADALGRG
jgi:2-succinyl-6-hydroxy-2,4-cyclohexadiene-1-carboxylate synthase